MARKSKSKETTDAEVEPAENGAADGAEAQAAVAQQAPSIKMLAHYTRDLSFENVGAREDQGPSSEQPQISVNVGMDAKSKGDNRYQVVMKISGTAKVGELTRFLLELEYTGLFEIETENEALVHPIIFIECPRQLLPFARRVVADVVRDGGYPPLMLDNVDFAGLYRQRLTEWQAKRKEAQAAEGGETLN
ncbi:MAG: protein-export chaperone SecB [Pseudomonadota bacterium]